MPAPKGNKTTTSQKIYTPEETKEVYEKAAEAFKRLGKALNQLTSKTNGLL